MRCLSDGRLMLFYDRALPGAEMTGVRNHISSCPGCRARLEEMEKNLDRLLGKMDLLTPEGVPHPGAFHPGGKKRGRFRPALSAWLGSGRLALRPAVLAVTGIVFAACLLLSVLLFLPGPPPFSTAGAREFSIQSIEMEEQPAQVFIVKERDTKTALIWVEKK